MSENETTVGNSYGDQLDFVTVEDARRIIEELTEWLKENEDDILYHREMERTL